MSNNPANELFEFVLEKLADAPVGKRVRLYRAIAMHSGDPAEAKRLNLLAADLEELERKHAQLLLDFQNRLDGKGPHQ